MIAQYALRIAKNVEVGGNFLILLLSSSSDAAAPFLFGSGGVLVPRDVSADLLMFGFSYLNRGSLSNATSI